MRSTNEGINSMQKSKYEPYKISKVSMRLGVKSALKF